MLLEPAIDHNAQKQSCSSFSRSTPLQLTVRFDRAGRAPLTSSYDWEAGMVRAGDLAVVVPTWWLVPARSWVSSSR